MSILPNRRLVSIAKPTAVLASTLTQHATLKELRSIANYLEIGTSRDKWTQAARIASHCEKNGVRLSMFLSING